PPEGARVAVSVPESTDTGRHPAADLVRPSVAGRCGIAHRAETGRTTSRTDEALAFTRCSVLKVRTARRCSNEQSRPLAASVPTDDGNSLAAAVNRRTR